MQRKLFVFTSSLIIVALLFSTSIFAQQVPGPQVKATSAVLVDGVTGRLLWQKNAFEQRPIASTTKIMTAILALENSDLEAKALVSRKAQDTGESELDLKQNESMTVKDLLYALMVQSANDAAVVLAEKVGETEAGFVALMNKKAKQLGMANTHFANPSGLFATNHYSTAADLAKLAVYAEKNEAFSEIVQTKKINVNGSKRYPIENRNKLLWRYPYAVGIKTGYTKEAGYCLVSAARQGLKFLVAVVLNSPNADDSFSDSKSVLSYGFDNFDYHLVALKGASFRKVSVPYYFDKLPLSVRQTFGVLTSKPEKISYQIRLRKVKKLPIKEGERFGEVKVFSGRNLIGRSDLIANRSFKEKTLLQKVGFLISSIGLRLKQLFRYFAYAG